MKQFGDGEDAQNLAAAMLMSDDDDDVEPQITALENYFLLDAKKEPVSFSSLPLQLGNTGDHDASQFKKRLVLWGTDDTGVKRYKEVVAWKLGLEARQPEIAVLAADGGWINLVKPKHSYEEETVRTILITVQMLHFLRRKPDEPDEKLWSHLRKVFNKFDVRPSVDDLRNHRSLIKQFADKDPTLAKSETLRALIDGVYRKNSNKVGADHVEVKKPFIADDEEVDEMVTDENNNESDEEEDDDLFDSICAICDNGGDLLCCDGPCMRSFHAKKGTGEDSHCATLGYTESQVEAMNIFLCKNCKYKQHQCYICGDLEPSDGPAAKVFLCNNATCGHFYHPKCVAKLLHPQNEMEASELVKQITSGCSFTCPIHWCVRCKGLEDRTQESLQFAVCRRCPKSYHRKCLPREISFEDNEDEDIITRAWELPKRILIYCLDHKIDPDIDTPVRNHIKFPGHEKPTGFLKNRTKHLVKKMRSSDELFRDQPSKESAKMTDKIRLQERKQMVRTISVKTSAGNLDDEPKEKKARFLKRKIRLEPHMVEDASLSIEKPVKGQQQEQEMAPSPSSATRKIVPKSSFPIVDSETEKRVITWLGKQVSSLTTKDVTRRCCVPSTHVYSGGQTERIIAQGKLERSVQAVGAALEKLENGGNVDDAKAVCQPDVLKQLAKWQSKLRVYISPFIHGTRYSSFGRHFTKEEKLVEIVNKLHWYVEPGDMIVDFCCGANDFSRLMKEKLDQVQKRCRFKNYDLIQPKNHFCFEKRDWMTVKPSELPHGSQLIMGLNPPFGVKASLANKFIDKALSFKPKLVILIVPKETKRLDEKKTPYDLIWEDNECLAGKAFYLPGSVDHSDKTVEGWNASAPPLYLWSHPDWKKRHMKIAEEHNHTCIGNIVCHVGESGLSDLKEEAQSKTGKTQCHPREDNLSDDLPVWKEPEVADKRNSRSGKERDKSEDDKDKTERIAADSWTKKRARSEDEKDKTEMIAADHWTKKRARSEDEKDQTERIAVHVKEADVSDKVHGKKLANNEVPPPGNQKEHDCYENRSRKATPGLTDSFPPEKQVEVAYEETKLRSKKTTHDEQNDCVREDGRDAYWGESKSGQRNAGLLDVKFKEGEDSGISPTDGINVRNKSSNYLPYFSDRAAHCPTKEPWDAMLSRDACQDSYLERNYEHSSAFGSIDGNTLLPLSGYASAPTVDPHSLQTRRPDDNFYMQNPSASERCLATDMPMPGYRYGGQFGATNLQVSRTPIITDSLSNPAPDGISTNYGPLRYSLASSGARSSQPSSIHSFGLSSSGPLRGSVMDKYAYGLSGPSGHQSSVMDRYAPSLDGTKRFPYQYPFGRPDTFGGGRPHI